MNTQAANVSESSQAFAAWLSAWLRPLYWSVRVAEDLKRHTLLYSSLRLSSF